MKNILGRILVVALFLLVSCSNQPSSSSGSSEIDKPAATLEGDSLPVTQWPPAPLAGDATLQVASTGNCASAEINQLGSSIAGSYSFTTDEEVMTWFCDGAEFEDILMALETQELNGTPAQEMLEMRAQGLSWDDIWLIVGYVQ